MGERRRLLERLEHLVRRLVVHRLGALEDEHAAARLERRARGGGDDRLVDVADEHLVRAARRDPGQVGMDAVLDALARVVGIGGALGEQLGGERAGDVALARPGRAVEEVGVARPPVGRQRGARTARAWGCRSVPASTSVRQATTVRGRLITIEGLDGAGKTTLADALALRCARAGADVELLREPGGVELSERIRALVKDPALRSTRAPRRCSTPPRARSSSPSASRPLLDAGRWVLLDRFVDSSLAYQGAGRGLGRRGGARDQRLRHRRPRRPTGRCCCASTPPRATRAAAVRGEAPDRLEREDGAFFAAIGAAYDELAAADPARFRVIDARARARRGPRGGARGGRGPPTIGGVTRRILAAVLLVAGLALPPVAAAQQTTSPATAGQTTDPAAAAPDDRPRRGRPDDGPGRRGPDDGPGGDGSGGDGSGGHAARRHAHDRAGRDAAAGRHDGDRHGHAAGGDVRQRPRRGDHAPARGRAAGAGHRAVAGRPLAGLGPAVARPLASRDRRGRLARGERVGRVHRLDAPRALSRRAQPEPGTQQDTFQSPFSLATLPSTLIVPSV